MIGHTASRRALEPLFYCSMVQPVMASSSTAVKLNPGSKEGSFNISIICYISGGESIKMSILEFGKANTGQSRTKAKSRSDMLGWYSPISSQVLFIMFTVLTFNFRLKSHSRAGGARVCSLVKNLSTFYIKPCVKLPAPLQKYK